MKEDKSIDKDTKSKEKDIKDTNMNGIICDEYNNIIVSNLDDDGETCGILESDTETKYQKSYKERLLVKKQGEII